MSPAQAAKLGVTVPKAKHRSTRHVAPGPYATACHDCHELFFTMASETRHMEATGHARYELVLE